MTLLEICDILIVEDYILKGGVFFMNETKVMIIKEEKAKEFFSQKPDYDMIKKIKGTANKYAHNATWIKGRISRKAI